MFHLSVHSDRKEHSMTSYSECPTKTVAAANGVEYAYRELGAGAMPLVLRPHS
jgi:hypothetical protein